MIVIPGPASIELGENIAKIMGVESFPVEHRIFPDGESYTRLTGSFGGELVVIVQSTPSPQDARLIQLFQMTATAKELGAERIICCVPYLAYSRQDKRFIDGEAISLDIVLHLLKSLGADDLIVVDAHNEESLRRSHIIKTWNLSAIPLLAKYIRELGFDGAYSLGPDEGALHLAKSADEFLKGGFSFFEKRRDRKTGNIEMKVKDVDVNGRDAIVFDDIVSSGGTMVQAIAGLKQLGARRVVAACTHAFFIGEAEKRIIEAGADLIVATDTIKTKFSRVSVAPVIAQQLEKII